MGSISKVTALKTYFGSDGYPQVTTSEMMALRKEDPDGSMSWL